MKHSGPAAGKLDTYLALQHATEARDAAGGSSRTHATYANVWAHVAPIRGREFTASQQDTSRLEYRVIIRWRGDVLATDRLVLPNGDVLEIVAPINVNNMDHTLELMAAKHG